MLIDFGGTALIVTHDRWFLDRVATTILTFEGDGEVVLYQGNYSMYLALKAQAQAAARAEAEALAKEKRSPSPSASATSKKAAKEATPSPTLRRLTYAENIELGALPTKIDAAEEAVATLVERLGDPATYRDGGADVVALQRDLTTAREEAESLFERWEELEARREANDQ